MAYVTKEQMAAAWARIGASPDGRLARTHLLSLLMDGITCGQNPGAVHEGVGRLSLARELITLMDAECENAGNADAVFIVRADVGSSGVRGSGVSGISCVGVHSGINGDLPWHDGKNRSSRMRFWISFSEARMPNRLLTAMA